MELAEWIEVDYRTAWYMGHLIRKMLADPLWEKLFGIVEADEVYVGGRKKPKDHDTGPEPERPSVDAVMAAPLYS